jgi:hypothetical protein
VHDRAKSRTAMIRQSGLSTALSVGATAAIGDCEEPGFERDQ